MAMSENDMTNYGIKMAAYFAPKDPYLEFASVKDQWSVTLESTTSRGGSISTPNMTRNDTAYGQSIMAIRVGNRWAAVGTGGYVF